MEQPAALEGLVMSIFGGIFKNKRVLVTGHTGFKGSWLALWLNMMGANVSCISMKPIGEHNHWQYLNLGLPEYIVDIRNQEELLGVVKKIQPEIIFHLAAQALVIDGYLDPINNWSTNLMGTINILEAAKSCEELKIVVVVTSDKCYENKEWIWAYRETDALGGRDPYSASKAAAELAVSSYRDTYFSEKQIDLVSVRAGNVIGGGDWSNYRLIPDLIRTTHTKIPAQIRAPNAVRPWQHVLESLSGYLCLVQKCLERNGNYNAPWNFGPKESADISVGALAKKAQYYWDDIKYEEISTGEFYEATYLSIDSRKAKHHLGWSPVWEFDAALEKTIIWYKKFYLQKTIITKDQIGEYVSLAREKKLIWAE